MVRTIIIVLLIGAVVFLVGTALHWRMPDNIFGKEKEPINFKPLGEKFKQ
jgi:hypothetical protein